MYVNADRMDVKLKFKQLDEVNCFKYLGRKWQRMEHVYGILYTE